jgi:deoxycytidylate deaminase
MALPCKRCQRKIINSQIKKVIILKDDGIPMKINVQDYVNKDTEWYRNILDKSVNETLPK